MIYSRKCPKCETSILYKTKNSYNVAIKKNSNCKKCSCRGWTNINNLVKEGSRSNGFTGKSHNEETIKKLKSSDKSYTKTDDFKQKISNATKGEKNGMYGKSLYETWLNQYGKEEADKKYDIWKSKISNATKGEKNGMYGKSSPNGSGNGWSGWYKGTFFRSLLELSYIVNIFERFNIEWESAEQKKYIIKYVNSEGISRTYRPDFIVSNKYLIEIKPKKLHNSKSVKEKTNAAIDFCKSNNLIFKITETIKLSIDEIIELKNSNNLKFTDRYEQKFKTISAVSRTSRCR
jgi:hypothetical protein